MSPRFFSLLAWLGGAGATAFPAPLPSVLFGDFAVLQQGVPVPVWGRAEPGETVKVRFNQAQAEATAEADGRWQARLPALADGLKGELVFESDRGRVVSREVVTGDVWLCAGQSNMEWTVRKSAEADAEIAAARFPAIRQFKVRPATADRPRAEMAGEWVVCSPETAGNFTALGYFFARDLFRRNGRAQGLINCSWGGTSIETWLSEAALQANPAFGPVFARRQKSVAAHAAARPAHERELAAWTAEKQAAEAAGLVFAKKKPAPPPGGPGSRGPAGAFNAMVNPLVPYAVRAMLWYQGEANWKHPDEYGALFAALISDWRGRWGRPDLPFVFVQLPGSGADGTRCRPLIREGQAAALALPATAMVVTTDLGSGEIHPLDKQAFGERLARVVRPAVLGETVTAGGPAIAAAVRAGTGMRVTLAAGGGTPVLRPNAGGLGAFELAGRDRKFHPAAVQLDGRDLLVHCEAVGEPIALRYCWRENPSPVLFDQEGLPAAPFRTDSWIDPQPAVTASR